MLEDNYNSNQINPLHVSDDFSLPKASNTLSEDSTKDDIFYASALLGKDNPVDLYNNLLEEYNTRGEVAVVNNLRHDYKKSKDIEQASLIENIIGDETIDRNTKRNVLQEFAHGKYSVDPKLKDLFLDKMVEEDIATSYEPIDDLKLNSTNLKIGKLKAYQEYDDIVDKATDTLLNLKTAEKLTDDDILNALDNLKIKTNAAGVDNTQEAVRKSLEFLSEADGQPQDIGFGSHVVGNALTGFKAFVLGLIPWASEIVISPIAAPFSELTVTEIRNGVRDWWNNPYVGDWIKTDLGIDDLYNVIDNLAVKLGMDEGAIDKNLLARGLSGLDEILTDISMKVMPDNNEAIKIPLEILTGYLTASLMRGAKSSIVKGYTKYKSNPEQNNISGSSSRTEKKSATAKMDEKETTKTGKSKYDQDAPKTTVGTELEVKTNSPAVSVVSASPLKGQKLLEAALFDESGQVLNSLNLTLPQFLYHFGFPEAVFGKKIFPEHVDLTESFLAMDRLNAQAAYEYFLPQTLASTKHAEVVLQNKTNVLNAANDGVNLTVAPSLGKIHNTGVGIETSLVFRKSSASDYKSPFETLNAADTLLNKIKTVSEGVTDNLGDVYIDIINHEGKHHRAYTINEFRDLVFKNTEFKYMEEPRFRVRWKQDADFTDAVQSISEGFGKHQFQESNSILRKFVEATPLSGAFMKWGKFSKDFENAYRMHGIKANTFFNEHLKILKSRIDFKDKQFLADLDRLFVEQQGVADVFTINQIYSTLNYNFPRTRALQLQEVLTLTRNIEKFNYEFLNKYELHVAAKEGYKHFVDLETSLGDPYRVMVMEEFSLTDYLKDPVNKSIDVWDPTTKQGINVPLLADNAITGIQSVLLGDQAGRQILRLQKSYTDSTGAKYEYMLRDGAIDLNGPPNYIIPAKIGHLPLSMLSNFFIKAYPRQVKLNGRVLKAPTELSKLKTEFERFSDVLATAQTEGQARTWLSKNVKPNDPNFIYEVVKASELSRADMVEGLKLFERHLRNAKSRSTRPIENAIYNDAFSTFIETTQSVGSQAYMLPILDQFKTMFVSEYTKKLSNINPNNLDALGFPKNKADIRSGDPLVQAEALRVWETINQLENGRINHVGKWVANAFEYLADIADVKHPIENRLASKGRDFIASGLRKGERNAGHLSGSLLRFTNTAKIALSNPLKMLQQQPLPVIGPMLIAEPKAFFTTMKNVKGSILAQMSLFDSFKKYNKYTDELYTYAFEEGKIFNKKDYTTDKMAMLDQQLFIKYLNETGYLSIQEHIFSKGIGSARSEGLTSNRPGILRKATEMNRDVGFTFGEWLHKLGMAHVARTLWIKNNPGKNWRSNEALQQIYLDADKLAGSMNNLSRYNWQDTPFLNYIGQFGSYTMSASESIWNPSASPFSGKQRAALLAFNVFFYGMRQGMPYHISGAAIEYMHQNGMADIADMLDSPAMLNLIYRATYDTVFPRKDQYGNKIDSTMDPASVWSPMGNSFLGAPGDILRATLDMLGVAEYNDAGIGASATTLKQIFHGFFEIGSAMYRAEMPAEDQAIVAFKNLMKISSFGNGILNAMAYDTLNRKLNKFNQPVSEEQSWGDRGMELFSVPNEETRRRWENWKIELRSKDKVEQMSKLIYESLSLSKGKSATDIDYRLGIQAMNEVLKDNLNFSDTEIQEVWSKMNGYDKRRLETGLSATLDDIAKDHKIEGNVTPDMILKINNVLKDVRNPNAKQFLLHLKHDYEQRLASQKKGK